MSTPTARLPYADLPTVGEMGADGERARRLLGLPDPRDAWLRASSPARHPGQHEAPATQR